MLTEETTDGSIDGRRVEITMTIAILVAIGVPIAFVLGATIFDILRFFNVFGA